jgi:hypothetical protein
LILNLPAVCFVALLSLGIRLRGAQDNFYLVAELKYCSTTVILFTTLWVIFRLMQSHSSGDLIDSPISSIMVMLGCFFLFCSTVVRF